MFFLSVFLSVCVVLQLCRPLVISLGCRSVGVHVCLPFCRVWYVFAMSLFRYICVELCHSFGISLFRHSVRPWLVRSVCRYVCDCIYILRVSVCSLCRMSLFSSSCLSSCPSFFSYVFLYVCSSLFLYVCM